MEFDESIIHFNGMYNLPNNTVPTLDVGEGVQKRLVNFDTTLRKELSELDKILLMVNRLNDNPTEEEICDILTELADWLGDIQVYCASEMRKFGLPLFQILNIIMQSNFSKRGPNGEVFKDEHGKVLKGPNYWKPEPRIKDLIRHLREQEGRAGKGL